MISPSSLWVCRLCKVCLAEISSKIHFFRNLSKSLAKLLVHKIVLWAQGVVHSNFQVTRWFPDSWALRMLVRGVANSAANIYAQRNFKSLILQIFWYCLCVYILFTQFTVQCTLQIYAIVNRWKFKNILLHYPSILCTYTFPSIYRIGKQCTLCSLSCTVILPFYLI